MALYKSVYYYFFDPVLNSQGMKKLRYYYLGFYLHHLMLYQFLPRSAVLARYMLWACVRLSVTSRCPTKSTKHRIMQNKTT